MIKLKSMKTQLRRRSITENEQEQIFKRYEKFLASTYYSIAKDFNNIEPAQLNNLKTISRLVKILIIKFLSLLFAIRCIVNIFWPTEYIRNLTCNGFHYFGNSVLICMGLGAGATAGSLMLAASEQYFIFRGQSYQFEYMNKIKYRRLDYRLNNRFNNKFYRKFNWISRGVTALFMPSFIVSAVLYCSPTLIGYFDPELDFNISGISYKFKTNALFYYNYQALYSGLLSSPDGFMTFTS